MLVASIRRLAGMKADSRLQSLASKLSDYPDVHIDYAIINAGVLQYPNVSEPACSGIAQR